MSNSSPAQALKAKIGDVKAKFTDAAHRKSQDTHGSAVKPAAHSSADVTNPLPAPQSSATTTKTTTTGFSRTTTDRTEAFTRPDLERFDTAPVELPNSSAAKLPPNPATFSSGLKQSSKPTGAMLTGKQEHYLKRELISQQTAFEIAELASPTALQRFGAPFKSDAGEVAPEDSELPLLRYIFVHHVRNFPFLDQAKEKEFWQDRLQVFLESFASKRISSSEDRLEETKRKKLAMKATKLVELMMVSGIPTASGYEERIQFSEMEVVDRGANEAGLAVNVPEGREINGWDVNVAGVRTTSVKRNIRYHQHAEFMIRVKQKNKPEVYVGRRFGEFAKMHKHLRLEFPGKVLPPLPRKNKKTTSAALSGGKDDDDDAASVSSTDTESTDGPRDSVDSSSGGGGLMSYLGVGGNGHRRSTSSASGTSTPNNRTSMESRPARHHMMYREEQRVSLRAFLRTFLANEQLAGSKAMHNFLAMNPFKPNREETEDMERRKELDERRIREGKRFYEIARKRAKELDVHMEKFRRDIVEHNGLTTLFREIKQKERIADLNPEYQKFAEWLRIEVAATIYHVFLAEDNSPELFAQAKRIHSLIPYAALKNVIRFANPAAVMKGVLDLFLAQPLGARSLMQRIFSLALNDGIKSTQKTIDVLHQTINDSSLCEKIRMYTHAHEDVKDRIRAEAVEDDIDILVVILRTEEYGSELKTEQIGRIFNAYVAWNNAIENVDDEMRSGAEHFAQLKQYLKLVTRQRDKRQMMAIIEEPTTLRLFRDLFTIFYEPLVRVYKSANVYTSVTDFSSFADDAIKCITAAQRQDVSADPNQTVQSFIDLCARHEDDFYKFVHEVHIHDNGLFDKLMGWLEGILEFLRKGPRGGGKLDVDALMRGAVDVGRVDREKCVREIDSLIEWQMERKRWHNDKTRRKMAAEGGPPSAFSPATTTGDAQQVPSQLDGAAGSSGVGFRSSDFGLDPHDISDLGLGESDAEDDQADENEEAAQDEGVIDPIEAERRRRKRVQDALRSRKGEPVKPKVEELGSLREGFVAQLRMVLAE